MEWKGGDDDGYDECMAITGLGSLVKKVGYVTIYSLIVIDGLVCWCEGFVDSMISLSIIYKGQCLIYAFNVGSFS